MTGTGDYPDELTSLRQVGDEAVERLLAGHAAEPELEPVATAVRTLREMSVRPVEPSQALRAMMAAGAFTGAPAETYQPPGGRPARLAVAAATARIRRIRLAGKLAAGAVAAAVLGTATAGFAGSLPEPVQDRFETVVESVTPYRFTEKTGSEPAEPPTGPGADPTGPAGPAGSTGPGSSTGPAQPTGSPTDDAADDGPGNSENAPGRDRGRGQPGPPDDRGSGGRPTDLPPPAQDAPGQQHRPTAPPGQG
ncbi:MAG TPA: hypothetical protein VIL37_02455 [Natronosporangium sp.]